MIKIDSSSLIHSLKMDFTGVLSKLYDELVITPAVHEEVVIKGKRKGKAEAYICEKMVKEGEIIVHESPEIEIDLNLGPGEVEIIQNAINNACTCMIDEKKGRRIAVSLNLDVRNLSLALLEALKEEIINSEEFDSYLRKWIRYALPSPENVDYVKQMKKLVE